MRNYIKTEICKSTELDSYGNGCDPSTWQDFGVIEIFKTPDMESTLALIKQYHGTPYIFDNRLEVQVMENGDGQEAMPYQIEEWKAGNKKLYSATYSFYLTEVTEGPVENDSLCTHFPELEDNT